MEFSGVKLIDINQLGLSQIYLSTEKIAAVMEWFDPHNMDNFEPLSVRDFGNGRYTLTDGHTRAYVAYKNGVSVLPTIYDKDEMVTNETGQLLYRADIEWCKRFWLCHIGQLENRILEKSAYQKLWMERCDRSYELLTRTSCSEREHLQSFVSNFYLYGANEDLSVLYFESESGDLFYYKNNVLMPERPPMIVLTGPTAVGKTKLSIALAKAVGGEIISADSMQVYRHMDIGSAKITHEEMQGVPHHLIDVLEPSDAFNVVVFQQMCKECLAGIYERGHIPIVAGGTGFYIQALLRDIDFTENEENREYRTGLEQLAAEKGAEYLHEMLVKVDPESAGAIHANNIKRTIRALEFYHLTGTKISDHNEAEREKPAAYNSCYFVLNDDREKLYERIEKRIDEMLENGLVEEVQRLRAMGCHRGMVSMQGLGYKEILAYLEGEMSLEEATAILKRDTRHFAKRQLTWFRREQDVIWVNKDAFGYDEEQILDFMLGKLREHTIL